MKMLNSDLAEVGTIIKGMGALKVLCINLCNCPRSRERQMLEPLRQIQIPNATFVVVLPLYSDEVNSACSYEDEELPFIIERVDSYSGCMVSAVMSSCGRPRRPIWLTICYLPCLLPAFVLIEVIPYAARRTVNWVKKHARSRHDG